MQLEDFQQWHNGKPKNRFGDTCFYCKGEVLADTEEGREFQRNHPSSCYYTKRYEKWTRSRDTYGREIKKNDVIVLTNKGERKPVLFRAVAAYPSIVILQSLTRPEYRQKVKSFSCMVITDQLHANAERAKLNKVEHALEKKNGRYTLVEKATVTSKDSDKEGQES